MPDIGELRQVEQGAINVLSVTSATVRPAKIEFATVIYPDTPYDGPYTVTPGDDAQVLATAGKTMLRNVIVEPVPSNYGKIGWNGSVLTVS